MVAPPSLPLSKLVFIQLVYDIPIMDDYDTTDIPPDDETLLAEAGLATDDEMSPAW